MLTGTTEAKKNIADTTAPMSENQDYDIQYLEESTIETK
jgi:hypothetical protein